MIVNLKDNIAITFLLSLPPYLCNIEIPPMYHLNNKQVMKKFQKIGIELVKRYCNRFGSLRINGHSQSCVHRTQIRHCKYILQLIKRTDNESGYLNCTKQERNRNHGFGK